MHRPNYGNRTLLSERSDPKIGWSGERTLQKNDGAERSAEWGVAERERSGERRLQD